MSTYDTAKQLILSNTSLNDTALTHSFARLAVVLVTMKDICEKTKIYSILRGQYVYM